MRTICVKIEAIFHGATVAEVLKRSCQISARHMQRLKQRSGFVLRNGLPCKLADRVCEGDDVAVRLDDGEKSSIVSMLMALEILYEDEDLILLNKPKNISVHPSRDPMENTLENALAAYFEQTDDNPHPVSRLDKGTTGVITVAKSGYMHHLMKLVQHRGEFQKEYLALVHGVPPQTEGSIDLPIGRSEGSTLRQCIRSDGAAARTKYRLLDTDGRISAVQIFPQTGRMHQIRVHFAAIGCPLLGDWLYGNESELYDRPMLHARSVRLYHPLRNETLEITAPIPKDFLNELYDNGSCLRLRIRSNQR